MTCPHHPDPRPDCVECFIAGSEAWRPDDRSDVPRSKRRARSRFKCNRLPGCPTLAGRDCARRHYGERYLLDHVGTYSAPFGAWLQAYGAVSSPKPCAECPAGKARLALLGDEVDTAPPMRRLSQRGLARRAKTPPVRAGHLLRVWLDDIGATIKLTMSPSSDLSRWEGGSPGWQAYLSPGDTLARIVEGGELRHAEVKSARTAQATGHLAGERP